MVADNLQTIRESAPAVEGNHAEERLRTEITIGGDLPAPDGAGYLTLAIHAKRGFAGDSGKLVRV